MSDRINPESRIFHIGRECYIVYLGSARNDYRPFLRIGNIRGIPEEIHNAVSTTVITADHVGNPLVETLNASKFHARYLGDTTVVREIRKFFQSFDLPTDEIADYRSFKDGEKRHMVWFYSSGNIHLRFNDEVIFNLHRREKEDRHYIRLYDEAKSEFLRNPLRYIKQDFSGHGVVFSRGNAFWYESGELMAMTMKPAFSTSLMNRGVDPDFITTVVYDLEEDKLDSPEGAVFMGLIKRARQRKRQLRVLTALPQIQRKLKLLFPSRAEIPATLDVTDLSGRKKASFRDSVVKRKDSSSLVHRAGIPDVSFNNSPEAGVIVDSEDLSITVKGESGNSSFYIPDGMPVDFVASGITLSKALERYISLLLGNLKELLTPEESQAAQSMEKYARMIRDNYSAGKTAISQPLKQAQAAVRESLKRVQITECGPFWYYCSNFENYLGMFEQQAESGCPIGDSAGQVKDLVSRLFTRDVEPDMVLPFWGDLYFSERPVIFWRTTKRNFVAADIAAARSANKRIHDVTAVDNSEFTSEMNRLLSLIRSLGAGGEGPLTPEQLALLSPEEKIEENERPAPAHRRIEPRPVRPESKSNKKTQSEQKSSTRTSSSQKSSEVKKSEKRPAGANVAVPKGRKPAQPKKKIWPWILLILLILLLGGALAWDLSGSAPWGQITGKSSAQEKSLTDGPESSRTKDAKASKDISASGGSKKSASGSSAGKDGTDSAVSSAKTGKASASSKSSEASSKSGKDSTDSAVSSKALGGSGKSAKDSTSSGSSAKTGKASDSSKSAEASSSPDSSKSAKDSSASDSRAGYTGSPDSASQKTDNSESASAVKVDTDVAPRTKEEIKAYLNVGGRIPITEVDIHLAANKMAVLNGYKDLDYRVYTGNDPDWIYPGGILNLPDSGTYTVRKGDTIWFLAAREVRKGVEKDLKEYDFSVSALEKKSSSDKVLEEAKASLQKISTDSMAEAMRNLAGKALKSAKN